VNLTLFACKRFGRLSSEARDRELHPREEAFLETHRYACAKCRASESNGVVALNMLQMAALEPQVDEFSFDTRVIRRLHVQSNRESVRYWSPALVGFAIAGVAVMAALQLVSRSMELPTTASPQGEARVYTPRHSFPRLDIEQPNTRVR
jgi:hypothetical protein